MVAEDLFYVALGGTVVFMVVLAFALAIASYILTGIAYSRIAKVNGYEKIWWLAWIPIANFYLVARMGIDEETKHPRVLVWILFLIFFLGGSDSYPEVITEITLWLAIAVQVYVYILYVYKWFPKGKRALHIVLHIVSFGMVSFIYAMIKRNEEFYSYDKELQKRKFDAFNRIKASVSQHEDDLKSE